MSLHRSVLLLLLLLLASPALAQSNGGSTAQPEAGTISVVGHGVAYGAPDTATLEVGVTVGDPDVRRAVAQVDAGIAAVMQALADLGIPERAIRTVAYNVWREERHEGPNGTDVRVSYRAQHMLAVEIAGAENAGEALASAVEAGANAVGGISFAFSDAARLESEARAAAVEDARRKAAELAAAAGVQLGAPVSMEEVNGGGGPIPYYEQRSAAVMSASPVAPGELSVEVRVAVRYRLEPQQP